MLTDRHPPLAPKASAPERVSPTFHDWNPREAVGRCRPQIVDETLRDGVQSPSACDPRLGEKLELLHCMARLGIDCAALGYPAARRRQYEDAQRLARELATLRLAGCCAARALIHDVRPIVEIAQASGIQLQVGMFVGSSPLRQRAEGWNVEQLLRLSDEAIAFAVREGLDVLYVTEDSTRSSPETLSRLYTAAVRAGASQVCIADTVGHATPAGAWAIVRFTRTVLDACDARVGIDWHGHRDRGMDVANCLAAWNAGAERCHGTALGIGERCGNTPVELLLANRALLGFGHETLVHLAGYVELASRALGIEVAPHQPVVGRDAFRTATGTHASALLKARNVPGQSAAEEGLYSSIPASWLGQKHTIEVGPLSGEANVQAWLLEHEVPADASLVSAILNHAKSADRLLTARELEALVRAAGGARP